MTHAPLGLRGTTRLLGVMGWPVSHTKSPRMQAAAIHAAGLDLAYVPLPVAPENLREAVRGLRALGFVGANVTVPHKIAICEHLDRLDPLAAAIGAVNTVVVREDGALEGFNTDALGGVEALLQVAPRDLLTTREALVLGAGGAARAAAFGALHAGAPGVCLLNRTKEKAEALASSLSQQFPARAISVLDPGTRNGLSHIGTVFQMSSMGMGENTGMPLDPALLPQDAAVLEAVYAPLETPFLRACRARGLRCQDGLAMLVEQGALAFQLWTGHAPDRQAMRAAISTG